MSIPQEFDQSQHQRSAPIDVTLQQQGNLRHGGTDETVPVEVPAAGALKDVEERLGRRETVERRKEAERRKELLLIKPDRRINWRAPSVDGFRERVIRATPMAKAHLMQNPEQQREIEGRVWIGERKSCAGVSSERQRETTIVVSRPITRPSREGTLVDTNAGTRSRTMKEKSKSPGRAFKFRRQSPNRLPLSTSSHPRYHDRFLQFRTRSSDEGSSESFNGTLEMKGPGVYVVMTLEAAPLHLWLRLFASAMLLVMPCAPCVGLLLSSLERLSRAAEPVYGCPQCFTSRTRPSAPLFTPPSPNSRHSDHSISPSPVHFSLPNLSSDTNPSRSTPFLSIELALRCWNRYFTSNDDVTTQEEANALSAMHKTNGIAWASIAVMARSRIWGTGRCIRKVPIRLPALLKALASAVKYQKREMRQARQVHPKTVLQPKAHAFILEQPFAIEGRTNEVPPPPLSVLEANVLTRERAMAMTEYFATRPLEKNATDLVIHPTSPGLGESSHCAELRTRERRAARKEPVGGRASTSSVRFWIPEMLDWHRGSFVLCSPGSKSVPPFGRNVSRVEYKNKARRYGSNSLGPRNERESEERGTKVESKGNVILGEEEYSSVENFDSAELDRRFNLPTEAKKQWQTWVGHKRPRDTKLSPFRCGGTCVTGVARCGVPVEACGMGAGRAVQRSWVGVKMVERRKEAERRRESLRIKCDQGVKESSGKASGEWWARNRANGEPNEEPAKSACRSANACVCVRIARASEEDADWSGADARICERRGTQLRTTGDGRMRVMGKQLAGVLGDVTPPAIADSSPNRETDRYPLPSLRPPSFHRCCLRASPSSLPSLSCLRLQLLGFWVWQEIVILDR
ncbi:hypothetical protein FA13DRAFT_1717332 [Coprinellus micaceus]|uniref:Uncharacterized protein n=1 Tax=Coprinellus micaceus TaxID=71717 RepID=A0A4Y7SGK8_COPMI|nr:hypothetical protein FA13DRAFT_1717332 [Coprinellus micaceus]